MNRTHAPAYREVPIGFTTPYPANESSQPQLTLGPRRREDLETIRHTLIEMEKKRIAEGGAPADISAVLTLDNAAAVLAVGLRNRPDAWTITAEELPGLWEGVVQA